MFLIVPFKYFLTVTLSKIYILHCDPQNKYILGHIDTETHTYAHTQIHIEFNVYLDNNRRYQLK